MGLYHCPNLKGLFMQHKFIRLPEVKKITGLPKSSIYRKISENTFPRQISIGPKTVVWLESDIQEWMTEKINQAANQNNKSE
jgi:prophage regulatory protein